MQLTSRRRQLTAALLASALVAGACSGAGSEVNATAPDSQTAEEAQPPAAVDENAPSSDQPSQSGSSEADPTVDAEPNTSEQETPSDNPEPAGENQLPDVNVVDLATGEEVSLASFAPADTPIVLWFWAPH